MTSGDPSAASDRPDTRRPPTGPGEPAEFWDPDAIPAATVIVMRDKPGVGPQTLMLKRDPGLTFAGGMWVFPGGRIDDADTTGRPLSVSGPTLGSRPGGEALESAARRAAIRESAEEAGLTLDPGRLIRWSHWTAPVQSPRRYTTAFFLYVVGGDRTEVQIDDHEIRQFEWLTPRGVMERHTSGELGLTPPTFITLTQLLPFTTTASLLDSLAGRSIEHFATRFVIVGDTMIAMYHGDAGYESGDVDASGRRHRLSMDSVWRYERDQ